MESVGTAGAALCAPTGPLAPGPGLSDKTFPSWTCVGDGRVNVRVLTTGNLEADGEAPRAAVPGLPDASPRENFNDGPSRLYQPHGMSYAKGDGRRWESYVDQRLKEARQFLDAPASLQGKKSIDFR
ncbi:hypothetical protein Bbelb_234420 [Branchiostoma belcheri]|nr:hypothetical protein Bbelb_234420 [Branchiostoma belcheri]